MFRMYAAKDMDDEGWKVRTLIREHSCARSLENRNATQKWLVELFKEKVQEKPNFKCRDMREEVMREWNVRVSEQKCKRAKKMILEEIEGSYVDEFARLGAY